MTPIKIYVSEPDAVRGNCCPGDQTIEVDLTDWTPEDREILAGLVYSAGLGRNESRLRVVAPSEVGLRLLVEERKIETKAEAAKAARVEAAKVEAAALVADLAPRLTDDQLVTSDRGYIHWTWSPVTSYALTVPPAGRAVSPDDLRLGGGSFGCHMIPLPADVAARARKIASERNAALTAEREADRLEATRKAAEARAAEARRLAELAVIYELLDSAYLTSEQIERRDAGVLPEDEWCETRSVGVLSCLFAGNPPPFYVKLTSSDLEHSDECYEPRAKYERNTADELTAEQWATVKRFRAEITPRVNDLPGEGWKVDIEAGAHWGRCVACDSEWTGRLDIRVTIHHVPSAYRSSYDFALAD